jgi:polyhydroxyalkanoate synthase
MRRSCGLMLDLLMPRHETPFDVMIERAGVRLRAYAHRAESGPALVVVPAPIKRAYVWDLAPSVSVVQACIDAGFRTYLIEWREAPQPTAAGLATYADALILDCLEAVREPAVLVGHSLGGTLAAIFASLHPERVRALVLLQAPLSFNNDVGAVAALVRSTGFPDDIAGAQVPGTALSMFSLAASPHSFLWSRCVDWLASMNDPTTLRTHDLVERWALDEFPLPRALVADVVNGLYREDRFMNGTLAIAGRTAAAENVSAPVLAVIEPRSDVVPPTSMLPFVDAARSGDKQVLQYEGDIGVGLRHVGTLVGRSAHQLLWPRILAWARER